MKAPELLAPAGNLEKLKTAVHYGADAVYLGGKRYSLRAHAGNFTDDQLREAVTYAHTHGVKVYVTVNIFAHGRDLEGLEEYLLFLRHCNADGLIVSDPGILATARKVVPELAIHLSTQANVTNPASARFWEAQGVSRLNLAREMSLAEIRAIRQAVAAEIELFVHGALCISYSGRCLLSLYLTGRNANQGDCAHPCRYSYAVVEEKRPGQYFPVEEDEHGTYIFNAKDLCLLNRLPDLIAAGADSFKIEGRMKSVYYVGAVVRLYRAALDHLADHGGKGPLPQEFAAELEKIGSRGQTENFLDGTPEQSEMLYQGANVRQEFAPVAIVREAGETPLVEARNPIRPGDAIEYLDHGLVDRPCHIVALHDQEGVELAQANPNQLVRLTTDSTGFVFAENSLFRKRMT
ncbi:MAG: U32 family peptidase [Desulfobulbaceae bacterium]|nr:U32 family peptidase [Desulfobulbaceae bacterium]